MKDAVWIAERLRQIIDDKGLTPHEMRRQLEDICQAAIDLAGNTIMIYATTPPIEIILGRCRDCDRYSPTKCGCGECVLHGRIVRGHFVGRECYRPRKTDGKESK